MKSHQTKRLLFEGISLLALLSGCSSQASYSANLSLSQGEAVELTICGPSQTNKALEDAIVGFNKIYPLCAIHYETVMNYQTNLKTRLAKNAQVDLFVAPKIKDYLDLSYCEDFRSAPGLDLSNTLEGLISNSALTTGDINHLYYLPFGGEIRGLFVNKTLLSHLNLTLPTTYSEFMSTCAKIIGDDPQGAPSFVPLQSNPSNFAQLLFYPAIANLLANGSDAAANTAKVAACAEGVEEIFKPTLMRLYEIMSHYYYNYDYCESALSNFKSDEETDRAYSFLNIRKNATTGAYEKFDDLGNVPFMPWTLSSSRLLEKVKEDYGSQIDFQFILAPTTEEGGIAYLSPSNWIGMNKQSLHAPWALEFLNYLFSKEGNAIFAKTANLIPNSKDALNDVQTMFGIPSSRVCHVGQAAFSYPFYDIINTSLTAISKGNKAKYMVKNADGSYSLHPFEDYYASLSEAFLKQRNALSA